MYLFESLPNELFEMIAGHHEETSDMLRLSEVSPRFNNLISKSTRLMSKINVLWTEKRDGLEIPAKHRKYSDLLIFSVNECSLQLKKFCETFADSITHVRLWNCSFKMSEVHFMLSLVSSGLKSLCFINSPMLEQKLFPKIEMPRLKELRYNSDTAEKKFDVRVFISMVSTYSLENFYYDDITTGPLSAISGEADVLVEFIKRQKRLDCACLIPSTVNEVIKHWLTLRESKIRLSILTINYAGRPMRSSHWKFLESQMKSLRCLRVKNANLGDHDISNLLSLNLEELVLECCDLKWERCREIENDSIIILRIYYKDGPATKTSLEAIVHLISSCQVVISLDIEFPAYNDDLKPVLAVIANKDSISQLIILNPACVNATTFPFLKALCFRAGLDPEAEKREIIRLVIQNLHLELLLLDFKFTGDTCFEAILMKYAASTTFRYIYYL